MLVQYVNLLRMEKRPDKTTARNIFHKKKCCFSSYSLKAKES